MVLKTDIQATAVSYKNRAILIQGSSGVGKTYLALQLIEEKAKLIGDDIVEIFIKNNKLYCMSKEKLKGVAEVRGLGLIAGFKVAKPAPVLCVVRLHKKPVERLPQFRTTLLLNKKIPLFDFYACKTTEIQVRYLLKVLTGQMTLLKE